MSIKTDQDTELETKPANEATAFPLFKVVGIFETSEEATAAVDELKLRGFQGADIEVFSGDPGDEDIHTSGTGDGLLSRFIRALNNFTYDRIILERYEAALRTGNYLVAARIHKTEEKDGAAQILHRHNAHNVEYFGLAITEHISEKREAL